MKSAADGELWCDNETLVQAAHDGDAAGYKRVIQQVSRRHSIEDQTLAGLYMQPLLGHAVIEAVGGKPNENDIDRLSRKLWEPFRAILDFAIVDDLWDALAFNFDNVPRRREVSFDMFRLSASVALGVLISDPRRDLERMKPYADEWIRRWHVHAAERLGQPRIKRRWRRRQRR